MNEKKGIFTSKNLALNMQYDEGKFAWVLKYSERMLVGKGGHWRPKLAALFAPKMTSVLAANDKRTSDFAKTKLPLQIINKLLPS